MIQSVVSSKKDIFMIVSVACLGVSSFVYLPLERPCMILGPKAPAGTSQRHQVTTHLSVALLHSGDSQDPTVAFLERKRQTAQNPYQEVFHEIFRENRQVCLLSGPIFLRQIHQPRFTEDVFIKGLPLSSQYKARSGLLFVKFKGAGPRIAVM